MLPKPYYQDPAVTIYHGDCREIVPFLGKFDLLLTDPPYGIGQDRGRGGLRRSKMLGKKLPARRYEGTWDREAPNKRTFELILAAAREHIIWGGNYFELPVRTKWLCWDKQQTMPTYSDCELAWTTLPGIATKIKSLNGNGLLAVEKNRVHPTQKPLDLILWCISLATEPATILDPFAGSGTTGRAAKDLSKKATLIELDERYCEVSAKRMAQEVFDFGS